MDTRMFDALAADAAAAGRILREAIAAMAAAAEDTGITLRKAMPEMVWVLSEPRAKRRRMTGRKAKAQLNQRQLWRRRRANGRGTKGGARK